MATQFMTFKHSDFSLNVSETYDDKTVMVNMFGKGNVCQVFLTEPNLIELRKWISKNLRTIQKTKSKK